MIINKDTKIADLISQYPHLAKILVKDYGLHCVGCLGAMFETLAQGAKVHGMTEKEIEKMIKRLNNAKNKGS